jgi:hypothetical protein
MLAGVQSLDYMIQVEVDPGCTRPYKNTNLLQEVLILRPTPNQDGLQGSTVIDGAHMVLAGPTRGQLCLLYKNSEVNEQFVSNFAECLCAHV